MIAIDYSANSSYFIALTYGAFCLHIWNWVPYVFDCFVLQTASVENYFTLFSGYQAIKVIRYDNQAEEEPLVRFNDRRESTLFDGKDALIYD